MKKVEYINMNELYVFMADSFVTMVFILDKYEENAAKVTVENVTLSFFELNQIINN